MYRGRGQKGIQKIGDQGMPTGSPWMLVSVTDAALENPPDLKCSCIPIRTGMIPMPRRRCVSHERSTACCPLSSFQFKQIAIAYQVLSDKELRHKYNEFGQKNGGGVAEPAGGFQDPEEVFGKMFGGDRFDDFIGQISIGTCSPPFFRGVLIGRFREGYEGCIPTAA